MQTDYLTVADPFLVGDGPPTFSTCSALACRYPFIWDTNGYYRELGVSVFARRGEIKKAYQRKKGWKSPRLTYIFKQLLDPAIRAAYDSTPFGEVFHDAYVEDALRRSLAQQVANLKWRGRIEEANDLQAQYDSPFTDPVDEFGDRVESAYDARQWEWSYYLWQSSCQDTDRLRVWQEALVAAFRPYEEVLQIAVGFMGGTLSSWRVHRVGYRIVVFLNDGEVPRDALAVEAVQQVIETSRGEK